MRVFVDVDVQNDFCEPDGALYVPDSPNDLFRAIVKGAAHRGDPILGSVDSHAFDAWEFASNERRGPSGEKPGFPDHCVKGTRGWLKVEGTLPARFRFVPNVPFVDTDPLVKELVSKAAQAIYFEKEVYSLFANPNAERFLATLAKSSASPLELVVFGVATDYCVRAAALGLRERGYGTTVVTDAIRGINERGVKRSLEEMRSAGCKLATAEALGILGEGPRARSAGAEGDEHHILGSGRGAAEGGSSKQGPR